MHPELPLASAVIAVLVLVPLPAQLRARNIALIVLLISASVLNITYVINSVVWAENVRDMAPIWCDIATTFHFSWLVLAQGAALCVCRHLEWVTSSRSAKPSRTLFEVAMCCVLPLLYIPIRYIVAPNRYVILENLGCLPVIQITPLAVALKDGPSLIITTAGLFYACLAARNIIRRRLFAATGFRHSQATITKSRCIRLLVLCAIAGVWPLLSIILCLRHLSGKLSPWPGWAVAHRHFHEIPKYSLSGQSPAVRQPFALDVWNNVLSSFLGFAILVCTDDVCQDLRKVRDSLVSKVSGLCCCSCRRKKLHDSGSSTDGTISPSEKRNLPMVKHVDLPIPLPEAHLRVEVVTVNLRESISLPKTDNVNVV